jgi:hypothetical protein
MKDITRGRRKLQCDKLYYSHCLPIVNKNDQIEGNHKCIQSFCRKTRREEISLGPKYRWNDYVWFLECGVRTGFMGLCKVHSGVLCPYCNLYSASVNGGRVLKWL